MIVREMRSSWRFKCDVRILGRKDNDDLHTGNTHGQTRPPEETEHCIGVKERKETSKRVLQQRPPKET